VIELIGKELVPVWINVRTTPLPSLPIIGDVLVNATVDAGNKISDPFSKGFMVRSVVITPDGGTILNRRSKTIAGSMKQIAMGDLGYVEVSPADYWMMLRDAVEKFKSSR
jgi:hypothetical protein